MTLAISATASRPACGLLLERYAPYMSVNHDLDRSLVSFQANRAAPIYRWFKYKEGFSSQLVEYLATQLRPKAGSMLDPFAGAGAALFALRDMGWHTTGIEIMPVGVRAMEVRPAAEEIDASSLAKQVKRVNGVDFHALCPPDFSFQHLNITKDAFSPLAERELGGYLSFCDTEVRDLRVRKVMRFAAFCVLEEISFTRKDGQYLRWDHRSARTQVKGSFDKGIIPTFHDAIRRKLDMMVEDLGTPGLLERPTGPRGSLDIRQGSCLEILPEMRACSFDFVVTSPPYCNRYDYTRTYALELAFLGLDDEEVKRLRQGLLSCTVENKEKIEQLRRAYSDRRLGARWSRVDQTFKRQEAMAEVLVFLENERDRGRLNNPHIARMVRNYFYEMCFVIYELSRVLRPGGVIAMVNDNVRYAGREIPVDLILSDFANSFGLDVRHIWALPRGKGNSSQQMGSHGRSELRKCVYVWQKPA